LVPVLEFSTVRKYAGVTRSLAQAMLTMMLILTPMLLLSGAWTPPEAMAFVGERGKPHITDEIFHRFRP
jgi:hypothetical protein